MTWRLVRVAVPLQRRAGRGVSARRHQSLCRKPRAPEICPNAAGQPDRSFDRSSFRTAYCFHQDSTGSDCCRQRSCGNSPRPYRKRRQLPPRAIAEADDGIAIRHKPARRRRRPVAQSTSSHGARLHPQDGRELCFRHGHRGVGSRREVDEFRGWLPARARLGAGSGNGRMSWSERCLPMGSKATQTNSPGRAGFTTRWSENQVFWISSTCRLGYLVGRGCAIRRCTILCPDRRGDDRSAGTALGWLTLRAAE